MAINGDRKHHTLRLKPRILLGYFLPVALTFAVAGITHFGLENISQNANEAFDQNDILAFNDQVLEAAIESETGFSGFVMAGDERLLERMKSGRSAFGEAAAQLEQPVTDSVRLQAIRNLEQAMAELERWQDSIVALRRQNTDSARRQAAAAVMDGSGKRYLEDIRTKLREIQPYWSDRAPQNMERRNRSISTVWYSVWIGALFGAGVSVIAAIFIASRVTASIDDAVNAVSTTSAQIAATIEQQQLTTSQQAAAVTETTTTMEQVAASASHSAEQAEKMATSARQVIGLAGEGSATVEKTLGSIQSLKGKVGAIAEQILRLSEHTTQIGSITNLVSDVAVQTNMLALNAAVEAARAGDHGKGFSVVAVEIRKLADQSKKSAERINTLVNDILKAINSTVMVTEEGTKTVDENAKLANQTAETFNGVAESINVAFEGTQQISLTAKEQSLAIREIVNVMNDLAIRAKETASGISQTKMGIDRLKEVAKNLRSIV